LRTFRPAQTRIIQSEACFLSSSALVTDAYDWTFGYQLGEPGPQLGLLFSTRADLCSVVPAKSQWISWFLSSKGNEYFCEVEEDYILDRFNLTGLNTEVANYSQALDLITDNLGA
jgi:hypothetical protein